MKKDNLVYLEDILEHINSVESFIGDVDSENFAGDAKTRSAALWNLGVIGKAATKLSKDFLRAHPELELQKAIGMRNQLIHGYKKIDLATVRETIVDDLPILKKQIQIILKELN